MNCLGIIFSELHDKNIPELTQSRTLASVPFGGRYRFIDFVLSNLSNSGVDEVGVITKYNYQSLMDHIGSGKNWDLSRKQRGLVVLPPHGQGGGLHKTRFEAVRNIYSFIESSKKDYVILSDCDNVCNIDFEDVLEKHEQANADITVVYREKTIYEGAASKVVFELDSNSIVQKASMSVPQEGKQNAYTNIMLLKRQYLLNMIKNSPLVGTGSFTRDVLLSKGATKIFAYKFGGFYASVDSLKNYYRHSLEILDKQKRDSLFLTERPIFTKVRDSAPARFGSKAKICNSMIADGCDIQGTVQNSILFRGVKIGEGAVVKNSIVMQGTIVSKDSQLYAVITDKDVVIREKRVLSGHPELPYYIGKNTVL